MTSLFYVLRLSFQSLGLLTQTKIHRWKAQATFEKTLLLHGLPPEAAKELAQVYPDPLTGLFNLIQMTTK